MEYFDKYLYSGIKVLVVGKGSSSFVDEYRKKFVNIYGVEDVEHPFIYKGALSSINFPTDYFDVIICNDFKRNLLDECFRILKQANQGGRFIWNVPINPQIEDMLIGDGFEIDNGDNNSLIHARKPVQDRVKILFPPGIGDIYWSLVKLQSFLKAKNLGMPDIYISSLPDKYNSQTRAFPFLEMFPFLNATWLTVRNDFVGVDNIERSNEFWTHAYNSHEKGMYENVTGCDYFMVYNGAINVGIQLEDVDPQWSCNWNLPMFTSLHQESFKQKAQRMYGDYIIFYFGFRGTYKYWADQFPIDNIIQFIQQLSKDYTPILIGGAWDSEDVGLVRIMEETNCIDLLGRTTLEELFGLMKGSKMVVGFPNGVIMFAPVLGVKTLAIWSDHYPENTAWNVVPPYVRNELYFVEKAKDLTVDHLINRVMEVLA